MPDKTIEFIPGKGFNELVSKLKKEFSELETFLRRRTIESLRNAGKYIHQHILENKGRADYGKYLMPQLAKKVGKDASTLYRTLQLYRMYPILAVPQELTWEHLRGLITVKDAQERKKLEEKIIRNNWNSTEFREYLSSRRRFEQSAGQQQPITSLAFTRGVLWTRSLAENPQDEQELLLDMGFTVREKFSAPGLKLTKDDYLKIDPENDSFTKVSSKKDEIFTYKASVVDVIDGDTIKAFIELGLGLYIQQKLRLRGIDCPEMDTDEGVQAKKFVQARLNKCDFIIVKTYKDSSDKYDRYLADIFYLADEKDPDKVAQVGIFLNQELLDKGLARPWE